MSSLYIIVPCYNEEAILRDSAAVLLKKLRDLIASNIISDESRLLFVDDGSVDGTWSIIEALCEAREVCALKLSRNRGHQNALTAGLVKAWQYADASVSIDADLQDDVDSIDEMVRCWQDGTDVVCGVRSKRDTDTFLKRSTAHGFYTAMQLCGAKIIYDHADFRLLSRAATEKLLCFGTEDLFLRGLVTRLGYEPKVVYYERRARSAGESKYSLKKMLHLARRGFESGRQKMKDTPQIGELYIEREIIK